MTTLRAIVTAFAPEYLERYPHLPLSHRKVISAIQNWGSRRYQRKIFGKGDSNEITGGR